MKYLLAFALVGCALAGDIPKTKFHHCTYVGRTGNSPHLFDMSEIYKCDEGTIEIAGTWNETIEYGYVYGTELGRPSRSEPHKVTDWDYANAKWCATPQPWDKTHQERCGDKNHVCWDGKMGTWDPDWQGYSCVATDHNGKKP